MYEYQATIVRNVDGDTVHALVDLGCDISVHLSLRFAGINAPEMSTPEGQMVAKYVASKIPPGALVVIRTAKDRQEKFGRYLAWIYSLGAAVSLNERLVALGYAIPYGNLPVSPPTTVAP